MHNSKIIIWRFRVRARVLESVVGSFLGILPPIFTRTPSLSTYSPLSRSVFSSYLILLNVTIIVVCKNTV